jgi:YCII-related domain
VASAGKAGPLVHPARFGVTVDVRERSGARRRRSSHWQCGPPEKVRHATDALGFDYHGQDLTEKLAIACIDGIDVYFATSAGAISKRRSPRSDLSGEPPSAERSPGNNLSEPKPVPATLAWPSPNDSPSSVSSSATTSPRDPASSTRHRRRHLSATSVDGPFAETREQIAGFLIVECADLDEVIEVAATARAHRRRRRTQLTGRQCCKWWAPLRRQTFAVVIRAAHARFTARSWPDTPDRRPGGGVSTQLPRDHRQGPADPPSDLTYPQSPP